MIGPRLKLSIDALSVIIDVAGAVEVGILDVILKSSLRQHVRVGVAGHSNGSNDSGEDGLSVTGRPSPEGMRSGGGRLAENLETIRTRASERMENFMQRTTRY